MYVSKLFPMNQNFIINIKLQLDLSILILGQERKVLFVFQYYFAITLLPKQFSLWHKNG